MSNLHSMLACLRAGSKPVPCKTVLTTVNSRNAPVCHLHRLDLGLLQGWQQLRCTLEHAFPHREGGVFLQAVKGFAQHEGAIRPLHGQGGI